MMVDLNPYGRKGCRCFLVEATETVSHELDYVSVDEQRRWMPNAACSFHGILADYERGRRDTGVYAVVPVGYRPRDLSTPPDGPECPPGTHSMFDPCPGGCLNEDDEGVPYDDCVTGDMEHWLNCECTTEEGCKGPRGCSCSVNEPNDLCAYCSQVPRAWPCDEGEDIRTGDAYTLAPHTTEQKERGVLATVRRWIGRALWAHQR